MTAPKVAKVLAEDPVLAAIDNAPEEPMTQEEAEAFEKALLDRGATLTSDELLERLRPKP